MTESSPENAPRLQLQMVLQADVLDHPPAPQVPDGYTLRTYRPEDAEALIAVQRSAGFQKWDRELLDEMLAVALPEGIFLAERGGDLVAAAMATHNATDLHPFGGELGWVATHPDHRGRGLGRCVCAAVIGRFAAAGYRRVYLQTDDARLPALHVYLRLGFEPLLYAPDMAERWQAVRHKLAQHTRGRG